MLFNSVHFFIFAPVVIGLYFVLKEKGQRWLLLWSSFYFYAVFRVPFTLVLLFSVVVTYVLARLIENNLGNFKARLYLLGVVLANVGILYFLKYIDFSIRAANQILGYDSGDPSGFSTLGVIIPMGISFFSLQAIAYAVDVYRGEIKASRSVFHFALFLSFFPQLVAGPIMRAKDLLHQFTEVHKFDKNNLLAGLRLIAFGLFKKSIVADPIGVLVDQVFAAPDSYGWGALALGTSLFVIQIYCDFSGYSDIAIGTGRIMGFKIPINFMRPFMGVNITDLWRRWHLSLSTWLRDYIFIPLGGSRVSNTRIFVNSSITMTIGGIWHGADWTFVIWGFFHAVVLILERLLLQNKKIAGFYDKIPVVFRISYTFFVFSFSAVFFRAQPLSGRPEFSEGINVAWMYYERIFSFASGTIPFAVPLNVIAAIVALFVIESLQEFKGEQLKTFVRKPMVTVTLSAFMLFFCFLIYSVTTSPQFIYFQF